MKRFQILFRTYKHFVLNFNHESTESDYYKRAVRMRGKTVIDINRQSEKGITIFYILYISM